MFCTHAQGGVSVVESSGNLRPCCMAKTGAWENINDANNIGFRQCYAKTPVRETHRLFQNYTS